MNIKKFISLIKKIMKKSLIDYYSKSKKLSVRKRYRGLSNSFDEIITLAKEYFNNKAIIYYKKRKKQDKKLEKIQSKAIYEINKCINDCECYKKHKINYKLIPASSFSAKTNLINESDIDFAILVKDNNWNKTVCISNALGRCGYIFNDLRNTNNEKLTHWVFQKYINNVEIEGKVRDLDGFKELLKMHNYLDKKMNENDKIIITYIKYILKKNDETAYSDFKQFYYCNAGYHGKTKQLLYPLN